MAAAVLALASLAFCLNGAFAYRSSVCVCVDFGRKAVRSHGYSSSVCKGITALHSSNPAKSSVFDNDMTASSIAKMKKKLDSEFVNVALPAFVGLAAEPLVMIIDAMYVGRLGAVEQAGMGIAISAQYSVAKLYNDPLLKTSTSLVAGKSGDELAASVATAMTTALIIGLSQFLLYTVCAGPILNCVGVGAQSTMRSSALSYLQTRSLGIPAQTVMLVSNSIFRGRGDTKTPLYCTSAGNLVNILLDPILIFNCNMGCAGAGLANALSQWAVALPLVYLLNKSVPFLPLALSSFSGSRDVSKKGFLRSAFESYYKAGGLVLFRTVSKTSAYTIASSAAARLGAVPMAAYSLTFNLGFATAQLCESISIAVQALLARDMPLTTERKRIAAAHIMRRGLTLAMLVSGSLTSWTLFNRRSMVASMSAVPEVVELAASVMPVVLLAQVLKGLTSATGGILLGGLDWTYSTLSMFLASLVCAALTIVLPKGLQSIWIALSGFMFTQLVVATGRIFSNRGPWRGLREIILTEKRADTL